MRETRPIVKRLVVGPLATNAYVVELSGKAVIIDPGDEPGAILDAVKGLDVVAIVATHGHFDHIGAVKPLVERLGVRFLMHRLDWEVIGDLFGLGKAWGFEYPEPPTPSFVDEGSEVLGLKVMHLPGHTPGSIALVGPGFVMSGDTLFRGAYGRTDLPHGDEEALAKSLCRLVGEVPSNYVLYPGHGPPSTIGEEAKWVTQLLGCDQRIK